MVDRPRTGDDDETPRLPEVTTPPWLREGPTPDHPGLSAAGEPTVDGARASGGRPGSDRADPAQTGSEGAGTGGAAREVSTTRITLGAHRTGDAASAADRTQDWREKRSPATRVEPTGAPDELSTLPLRSGNPDSGRATQGPTVAAAAPGGRTARMAVMAAAAVAILGGSAVLGYVVAKGASSPSAQATAECSEVSEPDRVVGAGPGGLDTPAGTVLAFDHAYYVERSAAKAFEAVAPSSRMTEEQLRVDGVEQVPEGTTHCVEVREISPTLLEVDLTEYPPDADPVHIRQRVRVAENPDGTWGIVSITPAG